MTQTGYGLALSGGGSRAAAFHRGTLQALVELDLVDGAEVVSTVSGGSLFGTAWMAARTEHTGDADFLAAMRSELIRGFVTRSVGPRLLKLALPHYSRTNLIAETFNKIFFKGKTLANLPDTPKLCINSTILNNGQVGKFSKEGFSNWDLKDAAANPSYVVPIKDFPLALAVAASAAFPIGLPPVELERAVFPDTVEFRGALKGAKTIALTDGGVLENLGIQTLIKGSRFGTWNLVVSDAGTQGDPWRSRPIGNAFRSFGVWLGGGRTLDRVMLIMNAKQNRWARQQVIEQLQASWLADALEHRRDEDSVKTLLSQWKLQGRRNVLFVRVDQNWSSLLRGIPRYHLVHLGATPENAEELREGGATAIEQFLNNRGVDLRAAKAYYAQLGGDEGANEANNVATNFTGLPAYVVDKLAYHAAWQIHATHAIYWPKT